MLKSGKDSYGAYCAESAIEPHRPMLVRLNDRQLKKAIVCYGASIPHGPWQTFEDFGQFGAFGLPTIHVIRCPECSLIYHVPQDVVEVVPVLGFI